MSNVTELRTRRPTGRPGWPRILLSGAEGSWKSGTAALLSADERMGTMFWIEIGLGEQTADEYGALPGVNYEIVDHDGTWLDMYNQLGAAWDVAKAAEEAQEAPRALVIDAMSGIWSMLMVMGDDRARRKAAQKLADKNQSTAVAWSADYEASMTSDLWNLVRKRHDQLMTKVLTWPGPVVLISRERMATVFENDKPTKQKDWALECRKDLPSQITAWARLHGGGKATIKKLRSALSAFSVELGDRDVDVRDFSLATLIFDWVGCEVGVSEAARMVVPDADQDMPDEVTHTAPSGGGGSDRPQGGGGRQFDRPSQRPQPPTPEVVADYSGRLLVIADHVKATQLVDWFGGQSQPLRDAEAVLTEEDRERLGIQPDVAITLYGLAVTVADYVKRHSRSVREPLDAPIQGTADAA